MGGTSSIRRCCSLSWWVRLSTLLGAGNGSGLFAFEGEHGVVRRESSGRGSGLASGGIISTSSEPEGFALVPRAKCSNMVGVLAAQARMGRLG